MKNPVFQKVTIFRHFGPKWRPQGSADPERQIGGGVDSGDRPGAGLAGPPWLDEPGLDHRRLGRPWVDREVLSTNAVRTASSAAMHLEIRMHGATSMFFSPLAIARLF